MKAELIQAASEVIPNPQILVNVVSRRVRQLSLGHRPLVQTPPGTRAADIALTEIIEEKLTFESTVNQDEANTAIVVFPGKIASTKKAA
jgi:DNA-directed RNA polymerase subunit omega